MRGRASRPSEEAHVDLTPMLDVVFILLIFFIVTSTFLQEEALGAEPPPPQTNAPSNPAPAIIVYIDETDQIRVNRKLTDISAVRGGMERARAENPESALIIQAHPLARTGTIIEVRDIAYDAQMERVNIVRSAG
ncbi:MAG: biopolymer transporter ExbD [Pseudomonadota bacterium]|nr:biopolymer transporter ExbD [Pseudomonadota bacterium]